MLEFKAFFQTADAILKPHEASEYNLNLVLDIVRTEFQAKKLHKVVAQPPLAWSYLVAADKN